MTTANTLPLEGKTVLVTGAASGLGAALARRLAASGADIIGADLQEGRLDDSMAQLRAQGVQAHALVADIADPAAAACAVGYALDVFGRLDILVNNAGTDVTLPIDELAVEDIDRILAVNLRGPFLSSKFAFPVMQRQGSGHIVNILSTAAKRAWANASAYHASKWGLLGLSHALHVEGRAVGVKVTAVVSGGMRTPFLLDRFPDLDPNDFQDPANVARTVRFVLLQPDETVIPEITVLPMREKSWP